MTVQTGEIKIVIKDSKGDNFIEIVGEE